MLTNSKKPLMAFLFLLIASLACYSDSPLWVFGVTDVPPTATFLPTPGSGADEYPAKLNSGDLALAPNPTSASQAFFFVTRLPEDLQTGVRNAGGSCDYGAQLEILYIGNQFEDFKGNVYVDNIALSSTVEGQEPISETQFDFEGDVAAWNLNANLPAGKNISQASNVDFASLAGVSRLEETVIALDEVLGNAENISTEEVDELQAKLDALDGVIASLPSTSVDDLEALLITVDDTLGELEIASAQDLDAIYQTITGFLSGYEDTLVEVNTVVTNNSAILADLETVSAQDKQAILAELNVALGLDRENVISSLQSTLVEHLLSVLANIDGLDGVELSDSTEAAITVGSDLLGDPTNAAIEDIKNALTGISDVLAQDRQNLENNLVGALSVRLENLLDIINSESVLDNRGDVLDDLEAVRISREDVLADPDSATVADLRATFDEIVAALQQDRDDIIALDAVVENNTSVLQMQTDYNAERLLASASVRLAEDSSVGADWSTYSQISFEIFVPLDADPFLMQLILKRGSGESEVVTSRINLNAGRWTPITVDLSMFEDLTDVRELSFEIGPDPSRRYYLIECSGTVGWATEARLAGPVNIVPGQSALTRNVGSRDNPLTDGAPFGVAAGQSPPAPNSGPVFDDAAQQCLVGEVVDVESVFAYDSNTQDHQLWYLIACAAGRGWVAEDRLFGPLVLPETGGIGLISSEFPEGIDLTANAGSANDQNPIVGNCPTQQLIQTTEFSAIVGETENDLIPHYHIQCGDELAGWTDQSVLLEIPYTVGTSVMVIGPANIGDFEVSDIDTETETTDEQAGTEQTSGDSDQVDDIDDLVRNLRLAYISGDIELAEIEEEFRNIVVGQEAFNGDASEFLSATLTVDPGLPFEGNVAGECPTGTIITLQDVGSSEGAIYYNIQCGDVVGWINNIYLPNIAQLNVESTVWFVSPSTRGSGDADEGFSLRLEPKPNGKLLSDWQCALYQPVTVNRVVIYQRALKSLGFSLYYDITCQDINSVQISGFVEQREILPNILDRDPTTIIGG